MAERPASVVVGAAQVIPAMRAEKLASMAGEPVAAGGADLAVMLNRRFLDLG